MCLTFKAGYRIVSRRFAMRSRNMTRAIILATRFESAASAAHGQGWGDGQAHIKDGARAMAIC